MSTLVRHMEIGDATEVTQLIQKFYPENVPAGIEYNEKGILDVYGSVMPSSFVLVCDEVIVGLLVGMAHATFTSIHPVYQELIWFTDPTHRRHGIKLYNAMIEYCKQNNVKRVLMSSMLNDVHEKLEKFYIKKGFVPTEIHYLKEL